MNIFFDSFFLGVFVCFLAARSDFDHGGLNPVSSFELGLVFSNFFETFLFLISKLTYLGIFFFPSFPYTFWRI